MSTIRIGNAACSWGALEFDGMTSERIDYAQMLDELRETGYTGTELGDWGFMPTDPASLAQTLAQRGLTLLGAFVPVALRDPESHEAGAAHALQVARLLADVAELTQHDHQPFVVLADANGTDRVRTQHAGRITPERGLSHDEWQTFAQGAEHIARAVRDQTGLRTVFHHHCAGYVETPDEIARLLALTDPDLLGLVFDTGHYAYGSGTNDSQTVTDGLNRFGDRIWYVHFKDCEPHIADRARREGWDYFTAVRHGVFCELGRGIVDFPAVVSWLRNRGYHGWIVVEQDVLPGMGTPKASALRNRAYLRSIAL